MKYERHVVLADGVELYQGDCRDILSFLPKVDACVCDPPYGIGFVHSGKGGKLARSTAFGGKKLLVMMPLLTRPIFFRIGPLFCSGQTILPTSCPPCRSPVACGGFGYCRNRNDGKHTQYRYVRHEDRERFESDGWELIDDFADCHHGFYAVLMGKVEE